MIEFMSIAGSDKMQIWVLVKTNSKKESIEETKNGYIVSVKEKAENNKANLAVVKLLSKYFKKKVFIKSGLRNKRKIISVKQKCLYTIVTYR